MSRIPDEFEQHTAGEGGWSDWTYPTMKSYWLKCCDCGLVHEMQFEVVRKGKDMPDGTWEGKRVQGYRVGFRARRAEDE